MSAKFWNWYTLFFVYVFPLFFCYVGMWKSSALLATIGLAIGIIGWILFIASFIRKRTKYIKNLKEGEEILSHGERVQATIKNIDVDEYEGYNDVNATIEFKNLAGSMVEIDFPFRDSMPNQRRFAVGKKIYLRLNRRQNTEVPMMLDGARLGLRKSGELVLAVFSLIYCVVVFLVNYKVFSDGDGWRWLSPWHPWVLIPFWGMLLLNKINGVVGSLGMQTNAKDSNELMLYGVRTKAEITRSNQTGTYINEQPKMNIRIKYQHQRGQEHNVDKTQIVLLNELPKFQKGPVEILYLPDKPDIVKVL